MPGFPINLREPLGFLRGRSVRYDIALFETPQEPFLNPTRPSKTPIPFEPSQKGPGCRLAWGGKNRLEVVQFTVRTYRGQGDFSDTKFPVPYPNAETHPQNPTRKSRGKDQAGPFTGLDYSVENGPVKGTLSLRRYEKLGTALFSAQASNADPATWWKGVHFGLSGEGTVVFKLKFPGFSQGLAAFMNEEWWSHPRFPKRPEQIPTQTRFLAWRGKDGTYGCVLPLSGGDFVSGLVGVPGGLEVRVSTFDDARASAQGPAFVAAFGTDPYEMLDRAYGIAMKILGETAKPRTQKKFPEPLEYLGWCTWDAFYREVNAKGVVKQLESFRKKGLPMRTVLLDDGWYEMKDNQMMDSKADPKKFPGGLAPVIKTAKRKFGVKFVGAWHALTGYWMGIHPQNRLTGDMKDSLHFHKGWPPAPPVEEGPARKFYGAWHKYLKGQGVDYVKVDGQSHLLRYSRNRLPLAQAATNVQRALQGSVNRHFKDWMINCMCLGQDQSWNWHKSNITRSSDDYMLNGVESDPADHARINAYNSYWLSPVSWADWDMFWSSSPNRVLHQALRAVSGGPVYVSDKVGTSQAEVLKPLALSDGRLLRCDNVGQPTEDCLFTDPGTLPALKIMNKADEAGVLCLVQAGKKPGAVMASFRPSDISGLEGKEFAVWNWHLGEGRKMQVSDSWKVKLSKRGVSLFVAQPIRDGFAPIGIVDKLISPKTVKGWKVTATGAQIDLKEGGHFVAYSQKLPLSVKANGRDLPYTYEGGWFKTQVPGTKPAKLVIRF